MKTLLILAALVVLLVVPAASAANQKLVVSPNPSSVGDSLVFSGCGYTAGDTLLVRADRNTKTSEWIFQVNELVDPSGCFTTADASYAVPVAGKWTATVWTGSNHEALLNFFVG